MIEANRWRAQATYATLNSVEALSPVAGRGGGIDARYLGTATG
jgi:hypothetical protein